MKEIYVKPTARMHETRVKSFLNGTSRGSTGGDVTGNEGDDDVSTVGGVKAWNTSEIWSN